MLADELRDAYRRGVKEKKERFDQEITDILLKCAKKGELPYLDMEDLAFLLTNYYKDQHGNHYRVYPEFNDYGGFDMKWEQIYPVQKEETNA